MVKLIKFTKGIFGEDFSDKEEQPLFCGFPVDPQTCQNWPAELASDNSLPKCIKKSNNCYFSTSVFKPTPDGDYRKKDKFFHAAYAVVIDDIGTKVDSKSVPMPLSWEIETSPGNCQGGYILDEPCTDLQLIKNITKALADKKLTDPGAKGGTRWARLPHGLNTKGIYADEDGVSPTVSLVEWHPELRYSIDEIIAAYNLTVGGKRNIVQATGDDPVLAALVKAGLLKSLLATGKHDITCPWAKGHTSEIDHGTVYFEPSEENKGSGGFKCQHGHCGNRTIVDLRAFFGIAKDGSKADNLLEIALELVDQFHVFRDENGDPFVYLNGSCFPLKSREVKAHILRTVKVSAGKELKLGNLAEVLASLESKAICGDEELKLHLRIAKHKGYIWYDLGDGTAVKVAKKGWEIVEPPPLFRRYRHQKVQNVPPIKGGDPWKLFNFMNISIAHHLETLVMLITYLVPDIAHPIFHPHGAHGSGKTTICKMIKELIDPSSIDVVISPKNKMELIRLINRHHVSIFDNMTKLDSEMSDVLCVASTGGSVPKRELYSDDEDVIFNFQRCCGLNGINLLVTKPDLLDRTVLLHMTRIPPDKRMTDADLWRAFNQAKPEILGGMFDVLSKAKLYYKSVKLSELPRMADFAKWGFAVAEALGEGKGPQFIADYQANIKLQNAEVLQYNSLCLAVTLLMSAQKQWAGTVQEAYEALFALVNPVKTDGTFPADSKNLRKFLERIESILAEAEHITYSVSERPKKDGFHIQFWKSK